MIWNTKSSDGNGWGRFSVPREKGGKKRGVAILCHRSLGFTSENTYKDKKGRYILVAGTIRGVRIFFLNIYATK